MEAPKPCPEAETRLQWSNGDVFEADLITRKVRLHRNYFKKDEYLSGDTEGAATQTLTSEGNGVLASTLSSHDSRILKQDGGTDKDVRVVDVEPADVHEQLHESSRGEWPQVNVECEESGSSQLQEGDEKKEEEEEVGSERRTSDQAPSPASSNKQSEFNGLVQFSDVSGECGGVGGTCVWVCTGCEGVVYLRC